MESQVDSQIQTTVLSGLSITAAAGVDRRRDTADQLAGDSRAVWTSSLVSPTVMGGMGFRVAQQSEGYPGKANIS